MRGSPSPTANACSKRRATRSDSSSSVAAMATPSRRTRPITSPSSPPSCAPFIRADSPASLFLLPTPCSLLFGTPLAELKGVTDPTWEAERTALLGKRISDLGLTVRGTRVERLAAQLYTELGARGIAFKPAVYLSDE